MSVTPETSVTPDPYGATMLNILKFLLFVLRHGGETPTNVRNDASGSEPTNLQPSSRTHRRGSSTSGTITTTDRVC